MRFNGQKHNRGIHCLSNVPDHQVLARARIKGLLIHPGVLETCDPVTAQALKGMRRKTTSSDTYSKF